MSIASPTTTTRILNPKLERKIMSAETAAGLIQSGDQIGMSGFTGSGYPKAVPLQLAHRIADAHFPERSSRSACSRALQPGLSWTGRWRWQAEFTFGFPTSRIPRRGSALMRARWITWISTLATWRSSWYMDFLASSMWR